MSIDVRLEGRPLLGWKREQTPIYSLGNHDATLEIGPEPGGESQPSFLIQGVLVLSQKGQGLILPLHPTLTHDARNSCIHAKNTQIST